MLPEQKRSWFMVVLFVVALSAVAVLVPFAGFHAWGALGVFGLAGLAPVLFREKSEEGQVARDERDEMIQHRATFGGFGVAHSWFVLGAMAVWFFCMFRDQEAFSIELLPFLVIVGTVLFFVTRAVMTLYLYREHGGDGTD